MKRSLVILVLVSLAACGVDGEPEPPAPRPVVAANIGVGQSGVHGNAAVGVSRGPVTLILGI
ncbi:hypothetical protein R5H30_13675 [Sulfitobacter sp. D35]|uniref:hypothetical protein n=1 Tax=Sulfitobacter sp. D35 TaxID=3083252 RepID=UPI00296E917F|nr:hypothetical protein [Sulfitobacter sp. D35]MDW4499040.1 hypothetical protein [Sulfitobacter sp. D35]